MARKAAAKKADKKPLASNPVAEPMSKSEIFATIADETSLSKKEVAAVFDAYSNLINRHIRKKGAGEFKMAGLFKIRVIKKPATKARKGINPFTGEETTFKAKPARNVVKIQALKALKDMAV